jgi:hypothetical protein
MWVALSDLKSGLKFSVLPGIVSAAFLRSESHGTHILLSIFETPTTWRARFLYLFPPGTGLSMQQYVQRPNIFTQELLVLYGCETWSLTLREEHRLRVFENRVLRRIFGPKRDEVTGEWRKLHNEELRDLYSSPSIIRTLKSRRMRWAGHVARVGRRGTRIDYWRESQRERDH